MTPAQELQAAADKLRAAATAAADDSGSTAWHTTRHFPERPDSTFTTLWATGSRTLLRGGGGRGRPPAYVSAPVGDYIAAMDPTVGLALAELLEAEARHRAAVDVGQPLSPQADAALTLARALTT
ncbi:hypothetical protein DV517_61910 [Streptomyces sp. S816]|uniref:hypothetical protein n=1 Tax=Streptomyces sp. S816 TaxID=2283197 RepID=UPI00109D0462|nr:hypothetical protein [Streptomyces sp. S816]TGZ14708.1 hypothetical protein DV517_61910 [Streptomyces sp. S816]